MLNKTLKLATLAGALALSSVVALAADQDRERTEQRTQTQAQEQQTIYGSQLMTEQERNEYRNRMRSAKTAEEQQQIRAEHHERMKVRAKEKGVTIPDEPPAQGAGMMAPGGGMGPGGGGKR
jgi:FKBP-type peptidyl-prolyl cis-trans isomerase